METLNSRDIISRKEHCCDFCWGTIKKGEMYNNSTHKSIVGVYTWKSHKHCQELVTELDMEGDEGVTNDIFSVCVQERYSELFPDADMDNIGVDDSEMAKAVYEDITSRSLTNEKI